MPYSDLTEVGLPGPGSLQLLHALEDHIGERLGSSGRLVAQETGSGVRLLHLYVDGTTPGVEVVRVAASGWEQGRPEIHDALDPSWDTVRHLAT